MNRRVVRAVLPTAIVLAAAAYLVLQLTRGDEPAADSTPAVALASSAPRFESWSDMAAASDVVVVATVVTIDRGRAITDPVDPTAGVRTQLAQLEVERALAGASGGALIVEQEATLLDGTPVVVDGIEPAAVGERAVWFLVGGGTEDFPYVAVIGPQGAVRLDDDDRLTVPDGLPRAGSSAELAEILPALG